MKEVSIPVPEQIGPYTVVRPLAQGGMAAVFEVEDPATREHLALKLLTHRGLAMPRFSREFRALTRLDHPNIVRVYRYGAHDGNPYLTMELLDGVPVQVHAKATGRPGDPKRTREVLRVVALVADALHYLHERGIVHRDLKSANILVLSDKRVKLLDFGTARLMSAVDRITRAGEFVGTFAYAAPEQIRGDEVDRRSDIYSLGALFYRLLTGKRIFEAPTPRELARMHLEKAPIPPRALVPALPEEVVELVLRMVAKDPSERPATAQEVADAIRGRAPTVDSREAVVISKPKRLIGRKAELEAIRGTLTKARPGRMVLIVGPAGSGRRRLLKAAIAEARGMGWRVFGGTFTGAGGLGVLSDVAEAAWTSLPPARATALQETVLRLRAHEMAGEVVDEEEARELGRCVARVVVERARLDGAPLVIGLSHLQRASTEALEAFSVLRQRARDEDVPVLFLACSTDDSDAPGAFLRHRLPDAWRVNLTPLSVEEVGELVRLMLGGTLSSGDLSRQIHALTGGWPGFVEEILRAMVQQGLLEAHRTGTTLTWVDRSEGQLSVPGGARDFILVRLSGVPREGLRLLEALAVAGGEADAEMLAHAVERPLDDTLERLEELDRSRVLSGQESAGHEVWSFRLGLSRSVILERLRPSRRYVLRRRLAEAVEGKAPSAQTARLKAAAGLYEAAVTDALAWGEPMIRGGRAPELLPVLEGVHAVLPASEQDPQRAAFQLLLARARAEVRPADPAVEEAFHQARQLADGLPERAQVDLHHASVLLERGDLESAGAKLHRALNDLAHDAPPSLRAQVRRDVGRLQWLKGRFDTASRWFDAALEAAREDGGDRVVARALIARAVALSAQGQLSESERHLREAIRLLGRSGHRDGLWLANSNLSDLLRLEGRFSEAVGVIEGELREARQAGTLARYAHLNLNMAEAEIELLRLGQARERLGALTAEIDPRHHLHLAAGVALAQGRVAIISAEHQRAAELLRPALAMSRRAGLLVIAPRLQATLGEALVRSGRAAEGKEQLEQAVTELESLGHVPALADACAARARALRGSEDPDELFAPVLEWLEKEPARLHRMEHLLSAARFARSRDQRDRARAFFQAADALLTEVTENLTPQDQESMRVHPWTVEVQRGLEP
ncbi:MAG: protein kinase [Alphaproteobacteria bacterium]|nr:protein kinase [Alphaproteobacteria bacterium]MCB9797978.1 protein kinase [Alphaproteobacteria bacterium]